MREAGRIVARVHAALREAIRPGVSTWDLDQLAVETMAQVQRNVVLPGLSWLSGQYLRQHQSRTGAWHSEAGSHSQGRRYHQHRHRRALSRLYRRQCLDLCGGRDQRRKRDELMQVTEESLYAGHRAGHGGQPGRGYQPGRTASTSRATACMSCANIRGMASGARCTRRRKCSTMSSDDPDGQTDACGRGW